MTDEGMEKIVGLAPLAVREVKRILAKPGNINAQIQVIGIILDRAHGKPTAALTVESGGDENVLEAAARLQAAMDTRI